MKFNKKYFVLFFMIIITIKTNVVYSINKATLENKSYTKLEEIVINSDNIIIGQIKHKETFSPELSKYTVIIKQQVKGNITKSIINIYDEVSAYKTNNIYLLFLNPIKNQLYPKPAFEFVDEKYGEIDISNFKSEGNIKKVETLSKKNIKQNEFINLIKSYKFIKNDKAKKFNISDESVTIDNLIKHSNSIAVVIIMDVAYQNKYIRRCNFAIEYEFKRNQGNYHIDPIVDTIDLPVCTKKYEECIIFSNKINQNDLVKASDYRVITSNSKQWKECNDKLISRFKGSNKIKCGDISNIYFDTQMTSLPKQKYIDKKDDIIKITSFINSFKYNTLYTYNYRGGEVFSLRFVGKKEFTISFAGRYVIFNGICYEIDDNPSAKLQNLYNSLDYKEDDLLKK